MRVAVVGAGFAGLSAAAELAEAGVEVSVLEARDRVGGRVASRTLPNGAVVELGAEFILPGNTVIRELAASLGLGLWDKGIRYGQREPRGGPEIPAGALAAAVAAIEAALGEDPTRRRQPAAAFLAELEIDPGAREYVLARAEISTATGAELIPAGDLLGVAHIDDQPSPSIAGGNQGIAIGLAARLGDRIRVSTPARGLRSTPGGGVRVLTDRDEVDADRAILALPAGPLLDLELDPPLPDAQRRALERIRYGQAAKLFVPLGSLPRPQAVISVPERFWCWTATGSGDQPQPLVSSFAGSEAALERLGVGDGPERWLGALAELRPELALEPEGAVLARWREDPWSRGAYSVSPDPELTEALLAPIGPLRLAGEHTAGEFSGLMEGALRSGRRAARELLGRS